MFREANWVDNAFSKYKHKTTIPQIHFNNQKLPKEENAYYNLNLLEMPNFWRKKTKKIKEPP